MTSTVTFLAYGGSAGMNRGRFGHSAGRTARDLVDALAYGLVTGGVFGWLSP